MLVKLAETLVGSGGVASVTWNNINQNGKDLMIIGKLRSTDSNTAVNVNFNSDTASGNYGTSYVQTFYSTESSSGTALSKIAHAAGSTLAAEKFATWEATILNYAGTRGKHILSGYGSPEGSYATIGNAAQRWQLDPITSITIYPVTGFAEGSKLYLYTYK